MQGAGKHSPTWPGVDSPAPGAPGGIERLQWTAPQRLPGRPAHTQAQLGRQPLLDSSTQAPTILLTVQPPRGSYLTSLHPTCLPPSLPLCPGPLGSAPPLPRSLPWFRAPHSPESATSQLAPEELFKLTDMIQSLSSFSRRFPGTGRRERESWWGSQPPPTSQSAPGSSPASHWCLNLSKIWIVRPLNTLCFLFEALAYKLSPVWEALPLFLPLSNPSAQMHLPTGSLLGLYCDPWRQLHRLLASHPNRVTSCQLQLCDLDRAFYTFVFSPIKWLWYLLHRVFMRAC